MGILWNLFACLVYRLMYITFHMSFLTMTACKWPVYRFPVNFCAFFIFQLFLPSVIAHFIENWITDVIQTPVLLVCHGNLLFFCIEFGVLAWKAIYAHNCRIFSIHTNVYDELDFGLKMRHSIDLQQVLKFREAIFGLFRYSKWEHIVNLVVICSCYVGTNRFIRLAARWRCFLKVCSFQKVLISNVFHFKWNQRCEKQWL